MATLHLTNPNQFISSSSIYVGFQQKNLYRDFLQLDFALRSRQRNARSGRDSGPYFTCSFAPMESAKIKVVGVGGGGNNTVNRMIGSGLQNLPQSNDAEEEYLDEDAIEALFSQLEEDLKNDNLSMDGSDDEISEEDLNRLESELEEALRDDDEISDLFNPPSDTVETAPETDEEEEEEQPVKLKSWQLKRLAYALKIGRRKTSIKSLAAELCLDRALVLELLREPPPNLLMMSATLPEKIVPTVQEPDSKTIESVPEETTVDVVEPEPKVRVAVHEMQSRWSAQKRLKKVQVETLERVYNRTKCPTNAMISSIVHVTNLPRKRVVKWFEDKRAEDGVPGHRIPYHRSAPDTVFIN